MYTDRFQQELNNKDYILFTRSGSDSMELAQIEDKVKGRILNAYGQSKRLDITRRHRIVKIINPALIAIYKKNQPVVEPKEEEREKTNYDFLNI